MSNRMSYRSGETETWSMAAERERSPDPVQTLRVLPRGPRFALDDFTLDGRPRRWLLVGSDADQDIVLGDRSVSALHCLIGRDHRTGHAYVADCDSKNGVLVNSTPIGAHHLLLEPGDKIRLGRVELLACGAAGDAQAAKLTARTEAELIAQAFHTYDNKSEIERKLDGPSRRKINRILDWLGLGKDKR